VYTDAVEVWGQPEAGGLLFTCEHASNRVPAPWRPRPADRRLLRDHWGYDIGARMVTRRLAHHAHTAAVLARFSRLLLDPNRDPADPTLILRSCGDEGDPSFNRSPDYQARIRRFHEPFHHAVDAVVRMGRPRLLLSIHSFTPVWRGVPRKVEAGVLFDSYDELGQGWVEALRSEGFLAEANQPYSGKEGLIYSANRHGTVHGLPYLELELRQDLIRSDRKAQQVARRVWSSICKAGL
jgi:predicted N-formylglutamate amidohydrolase